MNELLKRKAIFAPLLDIGASRLYQRRKRQLSLSPRYLTSNYVYLLPVARLIQCGSLLFAD